MLDKLNEMIRRRGGPLNECERFAVLEEMVPGGGYGVARRGDGSDGGAEGAAGAAEGVQRRSQLGAAASARLMAPRKPGFGALVLERP